MPHSLPLPPSPSRPLSPSTLPSILSPSYLGSVPNRACMRHSVYAEADSDRMCRRLGRLSRLSLQQGCHECLSDVASQEHSSVPSRVDSTPDLTITRTERWPAPDVDIAGGYQAHARPTAVRIACSRHEFSVCHRARARACASHQGLSVLARRALGALGTLVTARARDMQILD